MESEQNVTLDTQRLVLIADIHGNYEALKAILEDAEVNDETAVVCLGDIAGYGANTGECVEKLREIDAYSIQGNHDAALADQIPYRAMFNEKACRAIEITADLVEGHHVSYLGDRPEFLYATWGGLEFCFCHGSPDEPLMEYLTIDRAIYNPPYEIDQDIIGVGHTHEPMCLYADEVDYEALEFDGEKILHTHGTSGDVQLIDEESGENYDAQQLLINPGSVGQPRDGNERAAYLTLEKQGDETIEWEWNRVGYAVNEAAHQINQADLPRELGERLQVGE